MGSCRLLSIVNVGRTSYATSMKFMEKFVQSHLDCVNGITIKEKPLKSTINDSRNLDANAPNQPLNERPLNTLMLLEYDPVYTIGLREIKNLAPGEEERLKLLGADVCVSERGGLLTFHGPGQLVAYPILNLRNFAMSIKEYVRALEKVGTLCCDHYSLQSSLSKHPGVWIGNSKIASVGIRNQNLITSHGIAFNCNIDLKWFSHIVPCGLLGKGTTSLSKQTNQVITVDQFTPIFIKCFKKVFNCD